MRKLADLVHLEALSYTILPKLQTKILSYIVSKNTLVNPPPLFRQTEEVRSPALNLRNMNANCIVSS